MAKVGSSVTASVMNGDFSPATVTAAPITHPVIDGIGALTGPVRQKIVQAKSYHPVASLAAGKTLQSACAALVNTFLAVDPEGDGSGATNIPNTYVLSCHPHRPVGASGLASSNTHMVIVDWEFILPVDW